MRFYVSVIAAACLLSAGQSFAQDDYFKVSGQYRVRPEYRNGYKTLAADSSSAAFFIAQRARLIFDYKKENISSKISIQDSRTWGDEEAQKDVAGLQVNELWLELALNKKISLKLGRQELVYDDHRLLGNVEWGNITRSHDALVIKYVNKEKQFHWHAGGAFNQTGEPLYNTVYPLKNYKALGYTWLKKEFGKSHSISGLAIINGLNSTDPVSKKIKASITIGPLYNYNYNDWKAVLGAYYQGGKTENNLKLDAFMINAYAEKKVQKISAGLGVDYLSGNCDDTKPGHSNNFSTLYATNHKFYGQMDYFLNLPADTKQRGLIDAYARLNIFPSQQLIVTADLHRFSFAHENSTGDKALKKPAGTEVDITVEYKPSAVINLQAGYAMLFATKNLELVKGGDRENYNGWAFIMLKVTPVFFYNVLKNKSK